MTTPVKGEAEYRVIGEADLDTIPIRRVGWESPNRFDTLESAETYLAEVKRTDRDAINPRIEWREVGPWTPAQQKDTKEEGGS